MELSDEMLMAYADGELDPAAAGQVAAAVAADPTLAARVALFGQTRRAVAAALGGIAPSPSPDPVAERIRQLAAQARDRVQEQTAAAAPDNVIALPQRRQVPFWQLPLAASIALIAGLAAGQWLMRSPGVGADGTTLAIPGDPGLFAALAVLPSGSRQPLDSGAEVAVIATFENGDGSLCREFEYDQPAGVTTVAVACRVEAGPDAGPETGWDVQLAIAADAGATGYAPASSLEALEAWLIATGAGAPLSAEAEAAALAP